MKTGTLRDIGDQNPEKTRIFGGKNDKQFWSDKPVNQSNRTDSIGKRKGIKK